MRKLFLYLCFFLIFDNLYSQSIIQNMNAYSPPSPEAASLTSQAGQYSVGHYTGRLNYSASLMQVDFAGLMIDLGFKYSTAGFKVQDIAGSVGLGWNTSFGGVINIFGGGLLMEKDRIINRRIIINSEMPVSLGTGLLLEEYQATKFHCFACRRATMDSSMI